MRKSALLVLIFIAFCAVCAPAPSFAAVTDNECMECHSDKELVKAEKDGTQTSLFVDRVALKSSAHEKMSCTSCHGEIAEVPHEENLPQVKCEKCHAVEGKKLTAGAHIKTSGGCKSCHGTHDVKKVSDPRSPVNERAVTALCLDCHKDAKTATFRMSTHFQIAKKGKTPVTCSSCHDSHSARKPEDGKCVTCHSKVSAEINASTHKKVMRGNCSSCHKEHAAGTAAGGVGEKVVASCESCHKNEAVSFLKSTHGRELSRGNRDVPNCLTCHGGHNVLSPKDPASPVSHLLVAKTCIRCHEDAKVTARHGKMPSPATIKAYEKSVHGRILSSQGLSLSPTCSDCHGAHDMKPADEPTSSVAKKNIPATCGKCHLLIYEKYEESVHGKVLNLGISEAPVCTDCHGEHSIESGDVSTSKVAPANIPGTCSRCHEEEGIVGKYGLTTRRLETYRESFHGIANKYGQAVVANCASCHGFHDILPSSDPRSATNPANLPATCGKCHPGAGENFARGKIHVEVTRAQSPGVFFVRKFYTWFIGALGLVFVIHITLDLIGRRRRKKLTR